jgi:hypothetical protein
MQDELLEKLLKVYNDHKDEFKENFLRVNYYNLLKEIREKYGSFKNATEILNIQYKSHKVTKWDIHSVKQFIKDNSKCILISKEYANSTTNLTFQCSCGDQFETTFDRFKTRFKRTCRRCSGYAKSHSKPKNNGDKQQNKQWNKQIVESEVEKYIEKNGSLDGLHKNYPTCYQAIRREYGSIKNFYNQTEIPISKIVRGFGKKYQNTKWNKERIIDKIKILHFNNKPINSNYIKKYHDSLYWATRRHFGNWKNAVISSGIEYEEIMYDVPKTVKAGQDFEVILGDIFEELDIKYKKGFSFEIRPDFVIKDYLWADAKLSIYTIDSCETIEKYEPYVKQLWIIYLLGDKEIDKMITDKTRLTSVYKLIKQLPKHRRLLFVNRINKLKEAMSKKEDGVTKRNTLKNYEEYIEKAN